MTLHVITDMRRDLVRLRDQLLFGETVTPDQLRAHVDRLFGRIEEVEVYLDHAEVGETIVLTDAGVQAAYQYGQPRPYSRHLRVVEGGRA